MIMSVTEPTKEVTEPQLQTQGEREETQISEANDEKGEERKEHDDQIKHGSGSIDVDHDAQEMVISSLRTQIQDLFSQVNQLNNKLVRSYDRVSDLEDSLHVTSTNLQNSNQKVHQLELEKSQHVSQLTSGSLVEKSHVTAELTRLMERATEEAAQRGQAESAKEKIEGELEELSASLFGEANGMVEEARMARSHSERKVADAEGRLREAEEAVRMMQSQMQALMQEKEDIERNPGILTPNSSRNAVEGVENLMKGHLGYHEYLAFLTHLRHLHISNPSGVPPAMVTLLQLPFLSRLLNEDSEPTLRLDLAPSLNWLSRRSVLSAIHTGQLSVEPISAGTLFTSMESPWITIAGMSLSSLNVTTTKLEDLDINIPCALCGSSIFPIDTNIATPTSNNVYSTTQQSLTPHFASVHYTMSPHTTWSAAAGSFFRKPKPSLPLTRALSSTPTIHGVSINGNSTSPNAALSSSTTGIPSTTQSTHPIADSKYTINITPQTQIHIFRLTSLPSSASAALSSLSLPISKSLSQPVSSPMSNSSTSGSASSSRPASSGSLISSTTVASSQPTTFYPLCSSGWCLARLRTTCTLWSFIRTGIVEKVWDEEVILPTPSPSVPASPTRTASSTSTLAPVSQLSKNGTEQSRQGKAPPLPPRRRGIWGIASALGERAASWGEGASKEKRGFPFPTSDEKPGSGGGHTALVKAENMQTPLEDKNAESALNPSSAETGSASSSLPPPLPKRSVHRSLSHGRENSSLATTTPVETSTQPTLSGTTDSTDPSHTSAIHASSLGKSAYIQHSSLSQAANIPLPESRSETPALPADAKINGISAYINNTTPTPSRTSSPALPTVGPPPPVPRRAAARNKGGAGIVSSPSDGTKVDETPKKDQLSHKTRNEVTTSSEVGAVAEEGAVIEGEGKEQQAGAAKPPSDMSEGIAENKTVPSEQETLQVIQVTDKQTDLIPESQSGGTSDQTHMNAVVKTEEEENETELGEPISDAHEDHLTEPSLATSDSDPSDETNKVDQTQYVGTSTWEEKMWRELVKIRKDMFYARIGAANS